MISKEIDQLLQDVTAISNPKDYIRDIIIPSMMQRRGRAEPLTEEEVVSKIFNTPPHKPGEAYELFAGELQEKGFTLTPELASEIADVVYYISQPNCPGFTYYLLRFRELPDLCDILGIGTDEPDIFCILKYETRLKFGDQPNYKEIEYGVLEAYLNS